jgi:hypothetical protein
MFCEKTMTMQLIQEIRQTAGGININQGAILKVAELLT